MCFSGVRGVGCVHLYVRMCVSLCALRLELKKRSHHETGKWIFFFIKQREIQPLSDHLANRVNMMKCIIHFYTLPKTDCITKSKPQISLTRVSLVFLPIRPSGLVGEETTALDIVKFYLLLLATVSKT